MHVATTHSDAINYELLVSSLPGLYLILAPDLTIINASDAYLRSTSMVRKEIVGRKIFEVLPENPAIEATHPGNTLKKSLLHVLNFNTAHAIPVLRYDIPRPKNLGGGFEERYWMTSNHPITDKDGKLLYIVHHVSDVTVQQMAHRQINTHRERYELLAQAGADVIWDWDLLNNHIWWSEGFQEVFGYNALEFSNIEDWVQKVHPEDRDKVVKGMYETEDMGGKVWTDNYRFMRADGTYASIMERGFMLRDDNGVAYRMVGSMFDISEISEIAKTNQKTKPSHDNYQKILDAMPGLAWCIKPGSNPKNGVSYINKAWQEYTGLSTDLLNGASKVMHAEDLVPATTKLTKSLQTQNNYEDEVRLKSRKTGDYRWFLSRATPIRDEKGNVSLWFGTCTDINDQKEISTRTENKDTYWKKILTEAPLDIAVFKGPEHICEFVSPGFKKFIGNRKTEKMPLAVICPEMVDHGFVSVLDTVFQTGQSAHKVQPAAANDSDTNANFNFSFQPVQNEAGETESIVVIASEIPAPQPKPTNALAAEQVTEILEALPVMAWAASPEGAPVAANQLFAEATGLQENLDAKTWQALLHAEDRPQFRENWEKAQVSGVFTETAYRLKTADRNYRWFCGKAKLTKNAAGEDQFWLHTCTELDAQRKAEKALKTKTLEIQQLNENLDNFVYSAAHDLRKPVSNLAAIFEELTRTADFKDPEAENLINLFRKAIQQTHGNISHFAEIVETQSRPEEPLKPVSLAETADQVARLLEASINRSGATLKTDFSAAPFALLSEDNAKRMLYTLISNSLQYASPDRKPEITVTSKPAGKFTVLTISDNGLGIDLDENEGRMFRMFQRFHKHIPGRGLGLYLLNRIVTSNGGRIEVESTVDQGTTFRVYLKKPVGNILLIDDNEASSFLNKRLLSRMETGQEIEVKTNAQEALAYLQETCESGNACPDMVFVDLDMPVMNGFGFLQEYGPLKEKYPQLPEVILMASFTTNMDLARIKHNPLIKVHVANPLTETSVREIMQEISNS